MNKDEVPLPIDVRRFRTSLRLRFRFSGSQVKLIEQKRVEMIAPPSVGELPVAGRHSGTWIELRDGKDKKLFVRRLHDPFRGVVDHHGPDGKIEAVKRTVVSGEFEAIIPEIPQVRTAILFSSPNDANLRHEIAKEIGRYLIDDKESPPGNSQ